jgi:hypothetical protein
MATTAWKLWAAKMLLRATMVFVQAAATTHYCQRRLAGCSSSYNVCCLIATAANYSWTIEWA